MVIQVETCKCDLCNESANYHLYKMPDLRMRNYSQEYSVVECRSCGHRYLSPRPVLSSLKCLYRDSYYADRNGEILKQKRRYKRQASFLPLQTGKILDVGCAGGAWLKSLQKWERFGNDFIKSPFAEKDIDIRYGSLTECCFDDKFFDVVTAWGVMEHVYEPSVYFSKVHKLLKKGGFFIFMVPNGDSLWSRWAYKEDIPRHVNFFRPHILYKYAEKFSFEVTKIEFTNSIYSMPATGRGMLRTQTLKRLGKTWPEIHSGGFNLLGKIASLFDRMLIHPKIEEYLHLCGNMVVIFTKKDVIDGC